MFFKQLQKKLLSVTRNKTHQKHKKFTTPRINFDKGESESLALEEIDKLILERKYKQGLNLVNTTIESGITSQTLLAKKAFLLSHNKQYDRAHAIWDKLSKIKDQPKLAESAKQSLETSKKQQFKYIKNTKLLIDSLHTRADQFQHKLKHLPISEHWSPKDDIIEIVRKEAECARKADLPGLSIYFINQILQAGFKSPLLIHDKALTLSIIGQQKKSLRLLKELDNKVKNSQLKALISKSINEIRKSARLSQSRIDILLVKQARAAATSNHLEIKFVPETQEINKDIDVKYMIFKESRTALNQNNAQASLDIVDAIIDFSPDNLGALQLKGESLAALKKHNQARKIWGDLCLSKNKNIAKEASRLLSKNLSQKALNISSTKSPKEAVSYFIEEHLKLNLSPILNNKIKTILEQIEPSQANFSNLDLKKHELQLMFNTQVIECLNARLHDQGRLGAITLTQRSRANLLTAPKES